MKWKIIAFSSSSIASHNNLFNIKVDENFFRLEKYFSDIKLLGKSRLCLMEPNNIISFQC